MLIRPSAKITHLFCKNKRYAKRDHIFTFQHARETLTKTNICLIFFGKDSTVSLDELPLQSGLPIVGLLVLPLDRCERFL